MALPKITENMYFDTVLKAVETVLKAESLNQIALGGSGWNTVRERFDPWNVIKNDFTVGVANVVWSSANFPKSEGNAAWQRNNSSFDIDCYAAQKALATGAVITPKDQRAADVLHELVTKIYYTIMSPINYDMGLGVGKTDGPWITGIVKFVPTENNIPIMGVIAARISVDFKFNEEPPKAGENNLETINVITDTPQGAEVDQTLDVS